MAELYDLHLRALALPAPPAAPESSPAPNADAARRQRLARLRAMLGEARDDAA